VFDLLTSLGLPRDTSLMMKVDCESAGIAYKTAEGVADFHSHRSAFITALCRTNTDFALVMKLARHSTPKLTALVYDKVRLEDKAEAINMLSFKPK
jgi:hypothetical protein